MDRWWNFSKYLQSLCDTLFPDLTKATSTGRTEAEKHEPALSLSISTAN